MANFRQYCKVFFSGYGLGEGTGWFVSYADNSNDHQCVGPYKSELAAMNDLSRKEGWFLDQIDTSGSSNSFYMALKQRI